MASTTRLSPVTLLPLVTFLASAWLAAGLFYREMPDLVPTHWMVPWRADGFTAKPWGPFVLPITMTLVWLARRVLRQLSFPRVRAESFPGAFDFRIMLSIGVLFVFWNVAVVQAVSWQRAAAVPVSVALIVAGTFLFALSYSSVQLLGTHSLWKTEADWVRMRRVASLCFLTIGVTGLVILALSR
jgi:immunity protein, SdpI family